MGMTRKLDTSVRSAGDRRRNRAYLREFVPGIVAYMVVLSAALTWGGFGGTSPWRFLWALLPVLPMVWIVRALTRHFRRIDEYQRLRILESFSIAMAMTGAVTFCSLSVACQ